MGFDSMGFTLGIAQTGFPPDGDTVHNVQAVATRADRAAVSLLLFPENLMLPGEVSAEELRDIAQPLDGQFVQKVQRIAHDCRLWIVFTMSEENPTGDRPFNTAVVVDDTGAVRGTYRKCHLYDAHSVRESDRMAAGDQLCSPIHTPFCTLGVGICYDLRFPEVARDLALKGCDLLLFPAAWHDGPNKTLHWQTLLRARAIENECFVAGACHGAERYVRKGLVFDPLGNELAAGSDDLLTCYIDLQRVKAARDAMPIFAHRHPELYGRLSEPLV